MRKKLFTTLLIFILNQSFSQNSMKLGKISSEELKMTSCSFYPDAKSIILSEIGKLKFKYDNDKGWQYVFEYSVRTKIFSRDDVDAGTVKIRLYNPLNTASRESISDLKGQVFNGADKSDVKKIGKESIFETRINDYWSEVSITFPNISEGSIFDLSYTITSDYINNLRTWEFQKNIPVAYSSFEYSIPNYFNFQTSVEGSNILLSEKSEIRLESFKYTWTSTPGTGGAVETGTSSMDTQSTVKTYTATNVSPVIDEPFMNNRVNVPARIEFQLDWYEFPGQGEKKIAGNYSTFNSALLERDDFGKRLSDGEFARDMVASLSDSSTLQKAKRIYELLQKHFSWNQYSGFTSNVAGRKSYKEATGNVADINLTFLAVCRKAGIKCYPVILNTRGNGLVHPVYPSFDRFNYVIALIELESEYILVDVSSSLPFGVLPIKCRNGNGWKVTETGGEWLNLKMNSVYTSNVMINYSIENNQIAATINVKKEGYGALNDLNEYYRNGEDEFTDNVANSFKEWSVTNSSIQEMQWNQPVKYSFEIKKDMDTPATIYIEPILYGSERENPFVRNDRTSPIDYEYAIFKRVIVHITVPDGYSVSHPESKVMTLPENKGVFTYQITRSNNIIQIMSTLKLNETDYSPVEYDQIKTFYQLMVEKNNEIVILKKSSE